MKTRNYIIYLTTALCIGGSAAIFSACKQYLEVDPVSSFENDYTFSNVDNAQKAVYGAYASLGGDQGYGIRLNMYYPYDNDEMMGQGGPADNERRDIAHYNTQPSNTQLAGPFNQIFAGIERANICIYNIPKMPAFETGSEKEKKDLRKLYGEVLTLRAQFYYEAIRNWGDLPAQFQPSFLEKDLFKGKTNRDTIYNWILKDLAEAATLVPWRSASGTSNERISQGAVRALRARIALARGGYSLRNTKQMERSADYRTFYQIAKDECAIIMQQSEHNLNPSFQAVFKDAICAFKMEPNGEVLWEVGMTGGSSQQGDSKLGYYNGPRYNNLGNGALTILPTYFYSFGPRDTRRDVTCAPYNINADMTIAARTLQTMVDGKFRRDWIPNTVQSSAQYFGLNWPMIRYSDVLLMFAEADNELNGAPSAEAKAAFEKVRIRGFGGDATLIGTTPPDYSGFFNALVQERALEFGGEGIRKYDLIRWNLLSTRLNQAKAQMAAMVAQQAPYDKLPSKMYYTKSATSLTWLNSFYAPAPSTAPAQSANVVWINSGITTTILDFFAKGFTPNKSELLPLPQAVVDANPNLKQEYGY